MQTAYNLEMGNAYAGMLADAGENDIVSRNAEEEIGFGVLVTQGATDADHGCKLPDADTEKVVGISVHEHNEDGKYLIKATVNCLRKGRIWVTCATACAAGAVAYAIATTGQITNASAGNIAVGVFVNTLAATGLAQIDVNLP